MNAVVVSPRRVGFQIALLCVAFLLLSWQVWRLVPSGDGRRWLGISLAVAVLGLGAWGAARPRQSLQQLGLSPRRIGLGWTSILAMTLVGFVALAAVAAQQSTWNQSWWRYRWAMVYPVSVAIQQFLLQGFLNNRVYQVSGGSLRTTLIVGTCLMVVLHLPNPGLCLALLFVTPAWFWHFRRYQNLLALVFSHTVLGIAAMFLLGQGPLLYLRVGLRAWRMLFYPDSG